MFPQLKKSLASIILFYALIHFITAFFSIDIFEKGLSLLGLALFVFGLGYLPLNKFKLPITLVVTSIIIFIFSGTAIWPGLLEGLLKMKDIVGLLIIVPIISWVLQEEPYIEDITSLFQRFLNSSQKFYAMLLSFTQIISYFLLFGSITMMYQFSKVILPKQNSLAWENYLGTGVLRGYGLSTLWVISSPSFVFAADALGVPLKIAIAQGAFISVLGCLLAILFATVHEKRVKMKFTPVIKKEIKNIEQYASSPKVQKQKSIEFALLFLTLFGTIFLLHGFFDTPIMVLIPVVIIFWVILYFIYKKKLGHLNKHFVNFRKEEVVKKTYQLNVMMTVGILIVALEQTRFSDNVGQALLNVQEIVPFLNPLTIFPFVVILLGFMGMGPTTVMVLVAGILQSIHLPYPPALIVLAITSGSAISIMLSPLIMPVIVLSASNKLSLLKNGIQFNILYAFGFYLVVQVYIQFAIHLF